MNPARHTCRGGSALPMTWTSRSTPKRSAPAATNFARPSLSRRSLSLFPFQENPLCPISLFLCPLARKLLLSSDKKSKGNSDEYREPQPDQDARSLEEKVRQ